MKIKNNGFTLIELLAVIVILAIIALVATPVVLGIIKEAKTSSIERSIELYKSVVEQEFAKAELNGKLKEGEYTVSDDGKTLTNGDSIINIEYGGTKIKCNTVKYENGKLNIDNCDEAGKVSQEQYQVYNNGEVIYFDVDKGVTCTNYTESQSNTGVKSGCMKFYAFNDNSSSNKLNLILDHNTTAIIAWRNPSYNSKQPGEEFLSQLKSDTDSWKGTITPSNYSVDQLADFAGVMAGAKYTIDYTGYKARLITAQEVANITNNSSWNESTSYIGFYFDTNIDAVSTTCTSGNITGCKYGWLYDRTSSTCKTNGCLNNSNVTTNGYWTATTKAIGGTGEAVVSAYPWAVEYSASLYTHDPYNVDTDYYVFGIRPVITISKSLIN